MAINFERNKQGRVVAYEDGEKVGEILTMGDFIKEEELTPEQKKVREIKEKFEKKYANTVK